MKDHAWIAFSAAAIVLCIVHPGPKWLDTACILLNAMHIGSRMMVIVSRRAP